MYDKLLAYLVYKAGNGEYSEENVVAVLKFCFLVCSFCPVLQSSIIPTLAAKAGRCNALRKHDPVQVYA